MAKHATIQRRVARRRKAALEPAKTLGTHRGCGGAVLDFSHRFPGWRTCCGCSAGSQVSQPVPLEDILP